ncbi:MAG TPA: ATP-binding protein [Puia sp.]|nr:ATP-binding protein [Puia sp.]
MSIIKIAGIATWLLVSCISLSAQSTYHIERFTTDNGLPSNGIKGLQWDAQTGFLWIATEAGIVRYNGADFLLFDRANTPELYSERMLFLLKTREGRIFSSDETGDLFFVTRNKLAFMGRTRIDTRPASFRLTGLVASGRLFRQSSQQEPPDFGFNWFREQLVPLSEKRLLLTHNDTLYDYRLGKPLPAFVMTLPPDARIGYLDTTLFLFDPRHGFFQLDAGSGKKYPVTLQGLAPDQGAQENSSLFWDNGMPQPLLLEGPNVWIIRKTGERLEAQLICTALPTDGRISYLKYDSSSGLLFAGTQSKGLIVIRKNLVRPVRAPLRSPDQQTAYYSQVALPGGKVLTNEGPVFDGLGNASTFPAIHVPFNSYVLQEADSTLWYSHEDTIFTYSFRSRRTTTLFAGAGSVTTGFLQTAGGFYVANAIGIGVIRNSVIDYLYRYPQANNNSNVPFAMVEISPGHLAIATCEGLLRFNTVDHLLDTLLRIPGICVRALWKYNGYLFIGTYGRGIWLYKNGKLRPVPIDKKGYLQYAHCFIPDKLGYCWISTNRGLFRTRPQELIHAFDEGTPSVAYHYYGHDEGMDMTELNGGCTPCALSLNDTVLSFPSMDGLVWVNPTRPIPTLPRGSVYIDGFLADSQQIDLGSLVKPVLPAGTREIDFDLAFPAWLSKENPGIEYKLEPYNAFWQTLDPARSPELHFSNLPYGAYRLLVRQTGAAGRPDGSLVITGFYIQPHWYQQPWSWLLGLCLFCGLIIVIVRWRTRWFQIRQNNLEKQIAEKTWQLQVKNEELERTDLIKTRLISIISHDLVTPLRFLHMTGKNLIEKRRELPDELLQEAIGEMATTSKELELLGTNILNWIKYRNEDRRLAKESFDLHELVAQVFGVLGALARQKDIRLVNAMQENLVLYQYIEPVKIVLYNLVLNGINFTSSGHIRAASDYTRDGIALQIQDTGVGMTPEQINNIMADHFIISSANVDNRKGNGLGYLIIKDLLKILRGHLSIQSGKEKGTTVTVWVPL